MIDHVLARENYELAKRMLDAAALRQQALATNVANAETPGFHRVDLAPSFARQLAEVAAHPDEEAIAGLKPTLAEDATARAVRPDGNNVQLDRELLEINRNSLEYEFLAQYTTDCLKRIQTAITGRTQ